jgi:hypothetical protein
VTILHWAQSHPDLAGLILTIPAGVLAYVVTWAADQMVRR